MNPQIKLYFQKTAILLAVYAVLRYLLPIVLPFFLAWLTVCLLSVLHRKLHIRLLPLSVLYLFLILGLAGVAVVCCCCLLYEPCQDLIPLCMDYLERFSEYLSVPLQALSGYVSSAMPSALACLFGIFLYILSTMLFAKDWERFCLLLEKLPFSAPVSRAGKRITQSLKGWVKAQCRIILVITIECAVGYYLLNIPGFLFWAVLTGIVDALPVFGTGTIFLPWIALVLLQRHVSFALWLALLYLLTWLTRELLEPKLLGDGLGLLPVCFLMSVAIGLRLFGILGLFAGPFGVLLIRELWAELENPAPPERSWASSSGDEERSS
ncbi:MAG: AI-2E family transporter [Clostridiales bacterium]|nr:AI-2E family transporter [Clostridiales bacterium]